MLRRWAGSARDGLVAILDSCGVLDHAQPWLGGLGLILMFHRIVTAGTFVFDPFLAVDSESLDQLLLYIRNRGWEIISADELYDRLSNGLRGRPFVCLSFDDGYADNLTVALPVFRRHQAPFCVNVAVGYVDRTIPAWWDALGELLLQRDEIEFGAPGNKERIVLRTQEQKRAAYYRFRAILHKDVEAGRPPLGDMWQVNGANPLELSGCFFLTWKELRELAKDPLVTIGAHTLSHRSLKQLSESEALDEIEHSRKILEKKLGIRVQHFSYPFGTSDNCGEREFRIVQELKFKSAVTSRWCNIFPAHKDHLASLPRKFLSYGEVSDLTLRARLYGTDLALKPWRRVVFD